MICPNCQNPNPEGAKFCNQCGTKLPALCPNCGQENPPGSKFCNNCGQKLVIDDQPSALSAQESVTRDQTPAMEPSKSALNKFIPKELMTKLESARASGAMEGERRIVTMLFCDVKGSTGAAEQLDPEEWTEIINGAFEYMIRPIYQYEGTLARLMGDAILAFFGAPIAHEDDPQRAVLAGLEIISGMQAYREAVQEEWGIQFNVRVGINTGLVVVGAVGSDLRMEYTAMGDAINLAARMEQTAQPGTVQVAEDTHKLIAPFFEFEELGGITVKGKSEPVKAYRALGRKRTPVRLRGIEGFDTPLIGRKREKRMLEQAVANLTKGLGTVVCLTGEAGLGKSRLIQELKADSLKNEAKDHSDKSIWYETLSLSHETDQPYSLFRRLIRRMIGVTPGDSAEVLRDRLRALETDLPAVEAQTVRRVFESLYGLASESGQPPLEGESFKGLLFKVMASLWHQRAGQRGVVIVFDDLHWSDRASVELLIHLFSLTEKAPLLIICAMRPDRKAPGWRVKQVAEIDFPHRYMEISLGPLSAKASSQLVDSLLRIHDLPVKLRSRILEKSEGNPFFVEEVVRALIDQGAVVWSTNGAHWKAKGAVADIDIPGNLQALLMARIDLLEENDRRTLQLASVIGRSFYFRVLDRIADIVEELDQHLLALQRSELIQEAARVPELEYTFRHALTQEAAYRTILRRQRRTFHRRVGEAIEGLFPERREEMAATLAHHFHEAQDHEKASAYYTQAGDVSFRLFAVEEAVEHYTNALEISNANGLPEIPLQHLYNQRGRALELNSQFEQALTNYEEMEALARERHDQAMRLSALMNQGQIRCTANELFDPLQGEALSERALKLARELGDKAAGAKIHWNLLNLYRWSNRMEQSIEHGERSLALARSLDLREQMAFTLNDLAHSYAITGRLDQSMAVLGEARDLWRELGNLPMLADSLATSALYGGFFSGNYDQAISFSEESYQISQSIGNTWGLSYSRMVVGLAYWEQGRVDQAVDLMDEGIRLSEAAGFIIPQIVTRANLGNLYAELGDIDHGQELIDQALKVAEAEIPIFRGYVLSILTHLHLRQGHLAAAEDMAKEARQDPNREALTLYGLSIPLLEGEFALKKGDHERARAITGTLRTQINQTGARTYLPQALYLEGLALLALGQKDEAHESLLEARAEAHGLGSRRWLWQILLALAEVEDLSGNSVNAEALRGQVRDIIGFIGDHIGDEELRASFLAQPRVQDVLEREM